MHSGAMLDSVCHPGGSFLLPACIPVNHAASCLVIWIIRCVLRNVNHVSTLPVYARCAMHAGRGVHLSGVQLQ